MRPTVKFLSKDLIEKILSEAYSLLENLGVEIANESILKMLADNGARVEFDRSRAYVPGKMIDEALKSAPSAVKLYDTRGDLAVDLSGDKVHFTPGSAAIRFLDYGLDEMRPPTSTDYVAYTKLMTKLNYMTSQSTCMVPADVPERISDSYRLYLSLMGGSKPVITGTFTIEAFEVMKDLQLAVRGSKEALEKKPLTMFSCCPTAPIKWCDVTSQNVVDCARYGIPVEFISMPLSGFMAPVTLVGSLVQHTAETLSGVVISQLSKPGAPMVYGGSPAIFDIRYETTPMGAIETQMIDCAYNEIGKYLGLPTQAYIGLSDAKALDAQAGMESAMGATLAALAGINNISGPGMLDFESCISLEKLVLDNEICGSLLRMIKGIEPKEDFPSQPRFEELMTEEHLLISDHTRKYLKEELYLPGPVIERANYSRWVSEGKRTLGERAHAEVTRLIGEYEPPELDASIRKEMTRLMNAEALKFGMDCLPDATFEE